MLIGSVHHSIDAKGRYIVPSKFRSDLGKQFVITEGTDGCLFVFTLARWEIVSSQLAGQPARDEEARRFKRNFFSNAFDLEADAQFRVVVPPELRKMAGLDKDIVTVGVCTHLEIWDAEAWERYNSEQPISADSKADLLSGVIL